MNVVALDTSAKTGSVALCEDDALRAEFTLEMERAHSERLMPALDAAMRLVRWEGADVELIAVAVGPGPFTGLRVGVTSAKALAYAWGRPIVGVPTLDAIAYRHRFVARDVAVLLDARRQEVYGALYRLKPSGSDSGPLERAGEIRCAQVTELLDTITRPTLFVGDGAAVYAATIRARLGDLAAFADREAGICRASAVGALGARLFRTNPTSPADAFGLAPLYVRRSEAETKFDERTSGGLHDGT